MTLKEEKIIRKQALYNALKHSGKASVGAVLGKLISETPNLRNKTRELLPKVKLIVEEVNRLSIEEIRNLVISNWPELLEVKKEKTERGLPPLPNVEKYSMVVTRFSPNPDCVLHIGSVRAIILSHEYAKRYDGKFILRFEDTDPRLKKSALEFYASIRDDLKWLGCPWDEEYNQSDRLPTYYTHAEQLIKIGGGYVCCCSRESFREMASKGIACPCRRLSITEQMERWKGMLEGSYDEGEAVLRVKTDLSHPNPAIRDWPAFRIIDPIKYPHPRIGSNYRVWPLYNFACGVDDHLHKISHVIRGKEHMTNTVRQRYLYKHLGWDYPETIHYGRLKVVGADLSKSKIIRAVESGEVTGFDDPRLATLKALRRRGFSPKSFRNLIMKVGIKPVEATVSWENLYASNRKILDLSSNRYFYVEDPIKIVIRGVTSNIDVQLPYHPDQPSRGYRKISVKPAKNELNVYISRKDTKSIRTGQIVRLMELFNARIQEVGESSVKAEYHSKSVEEARELNARLIQWIVLKSNISTHVVKPDASVSVGLSEYSLIKENVGSIVQLVRFGFARIDEKKDNEVIMYFAHP